MEPVAQGDIGTNAARIRLNGPEGIIFSKAVDLTLPPLNVPASQFVSKNTDLGCGRTCHMNVTYPDVGGTDLKGAHTISVNLRSATCNYVIRANKKADRALPHPDMSSSVIVLRGGEGRTPPQVSVQVFNVKTRGKLGDYKFQEEVVYWKWLGAEFLAIVTPTTVYHWDLSCPEETSSPVVAFQRGGGLASTKCQVVGYSTDTPICKDVQWGFLTGITTGEVVGTIDGHQQLFNFEQNMQQLIPGFGGTFGLVRDSLTAAETVMIAFVEKPPGSSEHKIHVMDLATSSRRNRSATDTNRKAACVFHMPGNASDVILGLRFSRKESVIYGVTRCGFLFVFDAIGGEMLLRCQLPIEGAAFGVEVDDDGDLYVGTREGKIYSVALDDETFTSHVRSTMSPATGALADAVAKRAGFRDGDSEYEEMFLDLLNVHDYSGAGRLLSVTRSGKLRNGGTIQRVATENPAAVVPMLLAVLDNGGPLTADETVIFCRQLFAQGRVSEVKQKFIQGSLTPSVDLAAMVKEAGALDAADEAFNHDMDALQHYDVDRVRQFLLALNLKDPKLLIRFLDSHGRVEDIALHLYSTGLGKYLKVYATKVAPRNAAIITSVLVREGASDEYVKDLLSELNPVDCPPESLIDVLEGREKLHLMKDVLDAAIAGGSESEIINTAFVKSAVTSGDASAEYQIRHNRFYDKEELAAYCADRDPSMAFSALTQTLDPTLDVAVIKLAVDNRLYKRLAGYCFARAELCVWKTVLTIGKDNLHGVDITAEAQEEIISAVIHEVLDCVSIEAIIAAVRAFMQCGLKARLLDLLERVILTKSALQDAAMNSKVLQSMLIVTAAEVEPRRVAGYLSKLSQYDSVKVGEALERHGLEREAVTVYMAQPSTADRAILCMVNKLRDFDAAESFASGRPAALVTLGVALISKEDGDLSSVTTGLRVLAQGGDTKHIEVAIQAARKHGAQTDLVSYLKSLRSHPNARGCGELIEGELVKTLGSLDRFDEIEELKSTFINLPSLCKVADVMLEESGAGRGFVNKEVANRIALLFHGANSNYARIAQLKMAERDFTGALVAARAANLPKTWTELCLESVFASSFDIADKCVPYMLLLSDALDNAVKAYEDSGQGARLLEVIEKYLGLPNNPNFPGTGMTGGLGTAIGSLYIKYNPSGLMPFLTIEGVGAARLSQRRLVTTCETAGNVELGLRILFESVKDYDEALSFALKYSERLWEHAKFCELISHSVNVDFLYESLEFYAVKHPELLMDVLMKQSARIDVVRLVRSLSKLTHAKDCGVPLGVRLIFPYLVKAQGGRPSVARRAELDVLAAKFPLVYGHLGAEAPYPATSIDNSIANSALNSALLQLGDLGGIQESMSKGINYDKVSLANAVESLTGPSGTVFQTLRGLSYLRAGCLPEALEAFLPKKGSGAPVRIPDAIAIAVQGRSQKLADSLVKALANVGALNISVLLASAALLTNPRTGIQMSEVESIAWGFMKKRGDLAHDVGVLLQPLRIEHERRREKEMSLLRMKVLEQNTKLSNGKVAQLPLTQLTAPSPNSAKALEDKGSVGEGNWSHLRYVNN